MKRSTTSPLSWATGGADPAGPRRVGTSARRELSRRRALMTLPDDAQIPGSPEQDEILRLRAEVARLQLEKDEAERPTPNRQERDPSWPAGSLPFSCGADCRLACATVPALYLRSEVLDTDRYVATVAPLASDPAIQAEIANKVTAQITEAVDIEGITRDAMTELGKVAPRVAAVITGLAPAIAEQTKTLDPYRRLQIRCQPAVPGSLDPGQPGGPPGTSSTWLQATPAAPSASTRAARSRSPPRKLLPGSRPSLLSKEWTSRPGFRKSTRRSPFCSRPNWLGPRKPSERWTGPPRSWPG